MLTSDKEQERMYVEHFEDVLNRENTPELITHDAPKDVEIGVEHTSTKGIHSCCYQGTQDRKGTWS